MTVRMQPEKFRKKTHEVEAMRWDGTSTGATPVIDWLLALGLTATYRCSNPDRCAEFNGDAPHWITIRTPGTHLNVDVNLGDWVVQMPNGAISVLGSPEFDTAYEQAYPAYRPNVTEGGDADA